MPYIEIDIDDIYDDLGGRDKEHLVEWLREDGYLTKQDTEFEGSTSALQQLFEEDLTKIKRAYLQISKEDFQAINRIAKKY